jgi:AcrR family transcriptional regulator
MITNTEHPEKAGQILDVAQKRFGLYGLEKTSMREIAEDLNLSKGSLYYYFPDKESLYMAVIEKEQGLFVKHLEEVLFTTHSPDEILKKYVETRLHYFRSLLNLSRLRVEAFKGLRPGFQDKWMRFNEEEIRLISAILNKGIEQGQFYTDEPETLARLYLDVLRGLRQAVLSRKEMMYIDEKEYESLLDKAMRFTDLFLRAIRNNQQNNK